MIDMFRKSDCLLLRVGELALKSPPVQQRMFSVLIANVRTALAKAKIKYRIELGQNRIFVYTDKIEKAAATLQKIFGLTSLSPVWVCYSYIDEIKLLAVDIAEKILKLSPQKSFAIRSRRVGKHKFTSQAIAEEVGAAVKRVTGAKVNLSEPDYEIFIETRSKKTYIFTEKIPAVGGLPLGTAGKVLAIIRNAEDGAAAWLLAKRGCELVVLTDVKGKKFANALKKWHIGRRMPVQMTKIKNLKQIAEKNNLHVAVCGQKITKGILSEIKKANLLLLQPLVGWEKIEIAAIDTKIAKN